MRVMSNGRVRRTGDEWQKIGARWRESGLSAREFCRKEDLQLASFLRWQKRLIGPAKGEEFVPVTTTTVAPEDGSSWSLEIVLPNGTTLRFQG